MIGQKRVLATVCCKFKIFKLVERAEEEQASEVGLDPLSSGWKQAHGEGGPSSPLPPSLSRLQRDTQTLNLPMPRLFRNSVVVVVRRQTFGGEEQQNYYNVDSMCLPKLG
ncbi:hypothetical protein QQP08_023475 [Theobroma cacao]|nr:hypothetical protein QQP08_023475 [Theobroma cacao]